MKARTVVGRGEEGPLCDPGSELLLEGARGEQCEDNKWDGKKEVISIVGSDCCYRSPRDKISHHHYDSPDTWGAGCGWA